MQEVTHAGAPLSDCALVMAMNTSEKKTHAEGVGLHVRRPTRDDSIPRWSVLDGCQARPGGLPTEF
jgi:hypothetical protein